LSIFDLYPVPNLWEAKRILCVQPHPDDMDVACGGTLALLADAGARITYLTVTDGSAGTFVPRDEQELARIRKTEQEAAGREIGVTDYLWLDWWDADELPPGRLQQDLVCAIRRVRPDTVVTVDPWLPYEAHPAHRTVGLCTAAAALFSGLPNIGDNSPEAPGPHEVRRVVFVFTARPNTFIDVTATWARKLAAIRSHKSQFPDAVWPFYERYFEEKARELGGRANTALAEALKVLAPIHLHCNVDAEYM
jgi:LmbE family N-acetylglucosaminyl deacetylase